MMGPSGYRPMQYLTRWRIQLAARLLADGAAKVVAVGQEIGYASEAAFSRTFKTLAQPKRLGPALWRSEQARRHRAPDRPGPGNQRDSAIRLREKRLAQAVAQPRPALLRELHAVTGRRTLAA